ncbi:MAG TPA: hypothetical protein VF274_11230 [Alphaproteobacteria bacterium]|jgi:uncharacterized membrane protein
MATNAPTPVPAGRNHAEMAKIVYILYIVGFIVGITWLIGVVIAYIYRSDAPDPIKSHFTFQIWTFWLALAGSIVGGLTTIILIGFLVLLALVIWGIVRIVKGWKWLADGQPVPNPTSLLFGD